MSEPAKIPISSSAGVAPTPVNTPLTTGFAGTGAMSRPTVPTIEEGDVAAAGSDDDADSPPDSPPLGGAAGLGGLGSKAATQAALMGLVQSKLATLVGKSSGYIEALPVPIKRRVEGLKGVHIKYTQLQLEYKKEILELEKKYLKLYAPLFERRTSIISGSDQPTVEEIKAGEETSTKENPAYAPLPAPSADEVDKEKGIPDFWLTALRNHVGISGLITDRDEAALKHLTDISYEYLPDPQPGFKLVFKFSPNEFFTNEVLEKTYHYQDEVGYGGDFIYDRAIGCEINWKDEQDLTKHFEIKKQRNKTTNRTRVVRKAMPAESFFNFFTPPTPPSEEAVENGEIDEEELEDLEERLELDYQIGEDLKERIIPRAIDYFTGKALEYEGVDDEDEDDYEDDDDEDEDGFEDEDSDDDDDDDIPPPRRKAQAPPRRKVGGAGGAGSEDPQECKNQ